MKWKIKFGKVVLYLCIMGLLWYGTGRLYRYLRTYNKKSTQMLYSKKTSFDFGDVEPGSVVKHEFEISNVGKKALKIKKVLTSCTCTAGKPDKIRLLSGESTIISIAIDTMGKYGPVEEKISIITDFPDQHLELKISGNVRFLRTPSTKQLDFVYESKDEKQLKDFWIGLNGKARDAVLSPRTSGIPSYLRVLSSQEKNGKVRVSVELETRIAPEEFWKAIYLDSNKSVLRPYRIVVHGKLRKEIYSVLDTVYLGVVHPGKTYLRKVLIKKTELVTSLPNIEEISSATIDHATVNIRTKEKSGDGLYLILEIHIKEDAPVNGLIEGEVRIGHQETKLLRIPVKGFLYPAEDTFTK